MHKLPRFRRYPAAVAILTLALSAASCSTGGKAESQAPAGQGRGRGGAGGAGPAPITVARAVKKAMPLEVRAIGTVEASAIVAIRAQITGELTSVNFKEGDDVSEGQVLFTIDRRPLEAALKQAEANQARDEAQAANSAAQAKRTTDLAQRGIATREQVDTSRANAEASLATVGADRAAIENARVQLQYATIIAPISGRTGALMVHPGNLVRANDAAALVVINQLTPINVTFAVPEGQLALLKRYLARGEVQVGVQPPSDDGPPSAGRISFVDNAVDQTTGTIRVKGVFPNVDHLLWPGQYVNVVVKLSTDPNATVVPSVAVQTGPEGRYVYVIKADQTAELRPVEITRVFGNESIVARGVQPGETVVTDGHLRLVPGARVAIKNETERAPAP